MNLKQSIFQHVARLSVALIGLGIGISFTSHCAADEPLDRGALAIRDRIDLKSGSRIFGTFVEETKEDGRTYVVFKSADGIALKLDKARIISKLHQLTLEDIEYNKLLAGMSDTAEDHLRIYEWCGDQKSGSYRYKDQIQFHLERVMELDPNDEKVKKRLGYMYLKQQGRWVPEELYYDLNGYERKGAGWMPKLQRDVNESGDNGRLLAGEVTQKFKIWRNKLKKKIADEVALYKQLFQMANADSVNVIRDYAMDEKRTDLRLAYINAIGTVKTYDAMLALGYFAIEDPQSALRDRALTLLQQKDFYSKEEVTARLSGYLLVQNRDYLKRAAYAIGEIGSDSAILPLVGSLITRHQIGAIEDPNRMKTTFGNNGLDSFSTGGGDPSTKFRDFQNEEVSKALKKITGEDFGYARTTWRRWYVENHTLYNQSLRD